CVTEATRLADAEDDPGLQVGSRTSLVEALIMAGDLRAALAAIEEGLAKTVIASRRPPGETHLIDPAIWLVMMRGWVLFEMGRRAKRWSAHWRSSGSGARGFTGRP